MSVVSNGWSKVRAQLTEPTVFGRRCQGFFMLEELLPFIHSIAPSRVSISCDSVAMCVLSTVQIRSAGGQQSPYYAELEAAQTKAEEAHSGLWSKVLSSSRQISNWHSTSKQKVMLVCRMRLLFAAQSGLYILSLKMVRSPMSIFSLLLLASCSNLSPRSCSIMVCNHTASGKHKRACYAQQPPPSTRSTVQGIACPMQV